MQGGIPRDTLLSRFFWGIAGAAPLRSCCPVRGPALPPTPGLQEGARCCPARGLPRALPGRARAAVLNSCTAHLAHRDQGAQEPCAPRGPALSTDGHTRCPVLAAHQSFVPTFFWTLPGQLGGFPPSLPQAALPASGASLEMKQLSPLPCSPEIICLAWPSRLVGKSPRGLLLPGETPARPPSRTRTSTKTLSKPPPPPSPLAACGNQCEQTGF